MNYSFPVRVYYEDTDAGGRVYYANYLKYAERARTEVLRCLGIEQMELLREHGTGFVVRRCEVDFLKPALLDDTLTIETFVHDITKATLTMRQLISRNGETLVELSVRIAVVDAGTGRVARMPEHVFNALKGQ